MGLKAALSNYLIIYKKIIIKHLAVKCRTSAESEEEKKVQKKWLMCLLFN